MTIDDAVRKLQQAQNLLRDVQNDCAALSTGGPMHYTKVMMLDWLTDADRKIDLAVMLLYDESHKS